MKSKSNMSKFIRCLGVLALFLGAQTMSFSAEAQTPGIVLSAFGTGTVDGVISAGEWDDAATIGFNFVTFGDVHPSTLYVMNDDTYLYIAVVIRNEDFKESSLGVQGDILNLFFDNNHDGGIAFSNSEQGDDFVQLQNGFLGFFLDAFRCLPPVCASSTFAQHTDFGGSTDTIAAISHTNPSPGTIGDYVYEIAKKLNSGDTDHDFVIAPGQMVGLFLHFVDTPVDSNAGTPSTWPGPDACVNFQTNGVQCIGADIMVASRIIDVAIDIKPGSFPNSINLSSAGVVPVAILGSSTFDATQVDPATVSLAGAKVKLIGKGDKYSCNSEDVNDDGFADLVCHVLTVRFMIGLGDSIAVLEANTFSGQPIHGQDSIDIVP